MDRRVALGGVALAALLAPVAVHAQPPAPPAPAFNWSGFYVGVTAGGGSLTNRWEDVGNTNNTFWFDGTTQSFRSTGAVVGGYAGYNWQAARNLVLGVESDLSYNFATSNTMWPGHTSAGAPIIESDGLLQWTLRGRVGVTFDRVLFYATGGLAIGTPQTRNLFNNGNETPFVFHGARYGYVVGGGAEVMVTPNWIIRGEALFTDFGTQSLTTPLIGFPSGKTMRVRSTQTQARGGIAYKF